MPNCPHCKGLGWVWQQLLDGEVAKEDCLACEDERETEAQWEMERMAEEQETRLCEKDDYDNAPL